VIVPAGRTGPPLCVAMISPAGRAMPGVR